jgi:hypothetical protein
MPVRRIAYRIRVGILALLVYGVLTLAGTLTRRPDPNRSTPPFDANSL